MKPLQHDPVSEMKSECDRCSKPARIHITEIVDGKKVEKHLCQDCAVSEGITAKAEIPISQLLEDFILDAAGSAEASQPACQICGLNFAEFREKGLLGCPYDYDAFDELLEPILRRAHSGDTQHVGKVPRRGGQDFKRQNALLRLQAELRGAVASEDYERAAALRDQVKELEDE